ncbi:phosphoribosylanthranilate isomerase [Leuconostoc mesenteroides]|jgi:hypothetical protein|uniref:phosphoribosylanthranilate isomerase n=1 Tax=Leuconostoc mesenteroides TaxID=1245 RepID=UPI000DFF94A4|nr:phosphoribosylanthranilate isomerase [Leuconostoc mesenteroides]STY40009.1 Uncharacterised protein [Leuconostoc mesenteroides]
MKKIDAFLIIAKELNKVAITPVLMDSVGLEYLTKIDWQANDIDIHVPGNPNGWDAPDRLRIYQWDLILNIMLGLGFQLTDLHEHEFQKGDLSVAFGSIDCLPQFTNVDLQDLVENNLGSIKFLTPTLQQFMNIYTASSMDSYRQQQGNQKDLPKIVFLKKQLSLKKENNK